MFKKNITMQGPALLEFIQKCRSFFCQKHRFIQSKKFPNLSKFIHSIDLFRRICYNNKSESVFRSTLSIRSNSIGTGVKFYKKCIAEIAPFRAGWDYFFRLTAVNTKILKKKGYKNEKNYISHHINDSHADLFRARIRRGQLQR